jgi:adenosylhomocysteine nucleosidase
VVSTGLCGALDPALRIGDIVVATDVNGERCSLPQTARRYVSGRIVSIDQVADSPEHKRLLRQEYQAVAVEMEAAGVASKAREMGARFYCIRAVSDAADEDFVVDLNAARDRRGRFRIWHILGQVLLHPATGVPELLRLRRNAKRAARALGDFIATCDF